MKSKSNEPERYVLGRQFLDGRYVLFESDAHGNDVAARLDNWDKWVPILKFNSLLRDNANKPCPTTGERDDECWRNWRKEVLAWILRIKVKKKKKPYRKQKPGERKNAAWKRPDWALDFTPRR